MNRSEGFLTAVFGAPGSGKSRWCTRLLIELPYNEGALAWDPEGNVSQYLRREFEPLGEIGTRVVLDRQWSTPDEIVKAVKGTRDPLNPGVYLTPPKIVVVRGESYRWMFLQAAKALTDATIYIDECQSMVGLHLQEGTPADDVIKYVRNRNTEVIVCAQSPQEVATKVRSNASYVFAFRQELMHNIDALSMCADKHLWMPARSLPRFKALVKRPWRDSADEALIYYDSVNDPLITRMDVESFALWRKTHIRSPPAYRGEALRRR